MALLHLRGEYAETSDPLVRVTRNAAHRGGDRDERGALGVVSPGKGALGLVSLEAVEVGGKRDAVALRLGEAGRVVEDGVDVRRKGEGGAAHAAGTFADDVFTVAAVGGGRGQRAAKHGGNNDMEAIRPRPAEVDAHNVEYDTTSPRKRHDEQAYPPPFSTGRFASLRFFHAKSLRKQ